MRRLTQHLSTGQLDFLRVLGFGLGYLPTALIPRRMDPWLVQRLTNLALLVRPGAVDGIAEKMSRSLGEQAGHQDLSWEARNILEMDFESTWGRVRGLHRRGWNPTLSLDGLERIHESQAAGCGTVLWRMSLGSSLLVKKALWEQGVEIIHLSMDRHGAWSDAWIARRALCPIYRRTENWYLKERVIIPWSRETGGVMKTLLTRLGKENGVVSIVGDNKGTKNVATPFFDGQAEFAIGSPSLSWKTNSGLLPVYSVREGTGRYRVVIDSPILTDRSLPRKEFVKKAVEEFSQRMQDTIVRYPGSWGHWGRFWGRKSIFSIPEPGPIQGAAS